jgi:uncharacterized protein YegP (UPF0339 family)
MAVSETYESKQSAEHAIGVIKAGAAGARVSDHTKSNDNR